MTSTAAAVLPILTTPARILTLAASPVGPKLAAGEAMVVDDETLALIANMRSTLEAAHGWGIAAPQVGVSKRVILARVQGETKPALALINPVIQSSLGAQVGLEGCFSVPFKSRKVRRAQTVVVTGWSEDGLPIMLTATGMAARVLQHEIDHLNGILFTSRTS